MDDSPTLICPSEDVVPRTSASGREHKAKNEGDNVVEKALSSIRSSNELRCKFLTKFDVDYSFPISEQFVVSDFYFLAVVAVAELIIDIIVGHIFDFQGTSSSKTILKKSEPSCTSIGEPKDFFFSGSRRS